MKKFAALAVVISFACMAAGSASAKWWDKKPENNNTVEEAAAASSSVVKDPVSEPKRVTDEQVAKMKEMVAKKRVELNSTDWPVNVTPMGGKGKAEMDVISFADDKVVSKNLQTLGYGPTNFTLRMEDNNFVWETMQISETDGTAFWRCDVIDGTMQGVLSKRDKKNNVYDYGISSIAR